MEDEVYLEETQLKKKFKTYFELFQQNMVYHESPETFLEWSKFVYTLK